MLTVKGFKTRREADQKPKMKFSSGGSGNGQDIVRYEHFHI